MLAEEGAEPGWLCLELTESSLTTDPDRALEILAQLNRLGVRLSVDDFGTGYSSLAYLKHLPVDEVKVDRSFVMCMDENAERAGLSAPPLRSPSRRLPAFAGLPASVTGITETPRDGRSLRTVVRSACRASGQKEPEGGGPTAATVGRRSRRGRIGLDATTHVLP
jgi:hypothetical protein